MDDYVLEIRVAVGIQTGQNEELFGVVYGFHNVSQFASQLARQRERGGVDGVER